MSLTVRESDQGESLPSLVAVAAPPSPTAPPAPARAAPVQGWFSLWGPVIACMAGIFTLSSMPSPPTVAGAESFGHTGIYAVLTGLLVRALAAGRWESITLALALRAAFLATLYGVTDEIHQSWVPGRVPDAADLVANTIGAACAGAAAWAWGIISRRPPRA